MRATLAEWVNDADALYHVLRLGISKIPSQLEYVQTRSEDYYTALVGELFDRLHEPYDKSVEWSRLGNAIAQAGGVGDVDSTCIPKVLTPEAALFAAAAFYFGGYTASAYLTLKAVDSCAFEDVQLACYELLSKPSTIRSAYVRALMDAIRRGDLNAIRKQREEADEQEKVALQYGPDVWIGWRLFRQMLSKFEQTNIRAVLPDGEDEFWNPLIRSLLNRRPPVWDFFPSQIEAIRNGLLDSHSTFSIQMPTGAGKTALSETLIFHQLNKNPDDVAILLVPYRSLAAELRGSLVKHLSRMNLSARCAYGGTVPTSDEARELSSAHIIVATPEALSGHLSVAPDFFRRVSLVICDEGHLLDGEGRGVGLELLLARMRAQEGNPPKFVFLSAIVPNIEEINAWLGGTENTVVRSEYRPAHAEFAVLQRSDSSTNAPVELQLHPHLSESSFSIEGFLNRDDFHYLNLLTNRFRTYSFSSVKTQAIATARKTLSMGAVAVFAANKHGNQGAVGLAEELLSQLTKSMSMSEPIEFVSNVTKLQAAVEYFTLEYGAEWVGTRTLEAGAVLHHGDIPQESREVVEALVRQEHVRLVICTNTLAEGVNLPIRTLVLYSVKRRGPDGTTENLRHRDIQNLVGRAGRAGASTKGLVVCANSAQWPWVEPIALQKQGERVDGALFQLMRRLNTALIQKNIQLSNDILESVTELYTLIDGIDATLIDLAAEELGEDELIRIAVELSSQTFAARQAEPEITALIRNVFDLRARRVAAIKNAGRLNWIRETGTKARMLESVESTLLPSLNRWDNIEDPISPELVDTLLEWAWQLLDVQEAVNEAFRDAPPSLTDFASMVKGWLYGQPLVELARRINVDIDTMLVVHTKVLSYELLVSIEQGIALLKKISEESGGEVSQAVAEFPEYLRFGVRTPAAKSLAARGVRHRRAAVELGHSPELAGVTGEDTENIFNLARQLLADQERWLPVMGRLVLDNTIEDLQM